MAILGNWILGIMNIQIFQTATVSTAATMIIVLTILYIQAHNIYTTAEV